MITLPTDKNFRNAYHRARLVGRLCGAGSSVGLVAAAAAGLVVLAGAPMIVFTAATATAAALCLAGNAMGLSIDKDNRKNDEDNMLAHALRNKPAAATSAAAMSDLGFNHGLGHGLVAPLKMAALVVISPMVILTFALAIAAGGPRDAIYHELARALGFTHPKFGSTEDAKPSALEAAPAKLPAKISQKFRQVGARLSGLRMAKPQPSKQPKP